MQSLRVKLAVGVAVLGAAGVGTAAVAHDRSRFDASLSGYEEVPAISTEANGSFKAQISRGQRRDPLHARLRRPVQRRGGTVTQSHIHLGQEGVSGGVSVFLCGTTGFQPPAPTPRRRPARRRAHGQRRAHAGASDRAGRRRASRAGEFAELVRAIRAGATYANVHTTTFRPARSAARSPTTTTATSRH